MACLKAPVPYLNRALAEEQLGVDADPQNQHQDAEGQYSSAVKVCFPCASMKLLPCQSIVE